MAINLARLAQRAIGTANRLSGGHTVTITRTVPGAYDAATGTRGEPTTTTVTLPLVAAPAKPSASDTSPAAAMIRERQRVLQIAAADLPSGLIPQTGDRVGLIEGETWTVKSGSTLAPDGTTRVLVTVLVER